MGHIETRFRVAAPPDRIFDLVVDHARFLEWQTLLQEVIGRSGPLDAVGASFGGRYRVLGRDVNVRFVTTSSVRPYLHELTGTTRGGWARWATHIEADPKEPLGLRGTASIVRADLEYRLSGDLLGGVMALVADPILRREVNRSYERLCTLAEAAAVADADLAAAAGAGRGYPPIVS